MGMAETDAGGQHAGGVADRYPDCRGAPRRMDSRSALVAGAAPCDARHVHCVGAAAQHHHFMEEPVIRFGRPPDREDLPRSSRKACDCGSTGGRISPGRKRRVSRPLRPGPRRRRNHGTTVGAKDRGTRQIDRQEVCGGLGRSRHGPGRRGIQPRVRFHRYQACAAAVGPSELAETNVHTRIEPQRARGSRRNADSDRPGNRHRPVQRNTVRSGRTEPGRSGLLRD